jgi:hypothetical protein
MHLERVYRAFLQTYLVAFSVLGDRTYEFLLNLGKDGNAHQEAAQQAKQTIFRQASTQMTRQSCTTALVYDGIDPESRKMAFKLADAILDSSQAEGFRFFISLHELDMDLTYMNEKLASLLKWPKCIVSLLVAPAPQNNVSQQQSSFGKLLDFNEKLLSRSSGTPHILVLQLEKHNLTPS